MARKLSAYGGTSVDIGRTMEQLDRLMQKAGVAATRWTNYPKRIRFEFQPDEGGEAFRVELEIPEGYTERDHEQKRRQAFRLLYWYIKTKLEAIENGLGDFRREFLPYLVTGPETTFIQAVEEAIEHGAKSLPLGAEGLLLAAPEEVTDAECRDA